MCRILKDEKVEIVYLELTRYYSKMVAKTAYFRFVLAKRKKANLFLLVGIKSLSENKNRFPVYHLKLEESCLING